MSNSPLISCTILTANNYGKRNHKIDTITIHCMAAPLSVETCGHWFQQSKNSSSNYGIGPDGRTALYVPEEKGAWCSSNKANDMRSVTIEVASDPKPPYAVTDKALEATINLCVDICRRNGIKALVWSTSKADRVNHRNGCNMTVHRDYSAKSCPGDYLYARMGQIASAVNARLGEGGNKTYCGTGIGAGTAKEDMAIRDASSTKGAKIGEVRKGQQVEILQQLKNGWLKVVWPGSAKGYAYTSNAGGGYYDVNIPGAAKTGTVTNCWALNVRTAPNGSVIGTLPKGEQVTYTEQKNGWLHITSPRDGWVSGAYIS